MRRRSESKDRGHCLCAPPSRLAFAHVCCSFASILNNARLRTEALPSTLRTATTERMEKAQCTHGVGVGLQTHVGARIASCRPPGSSCSDRRAQGSRRGGARRSRCVHVTVEDVEGGVIFNGAAGRQTDRQATRSMELNRDREDKAYLRLVIRSIRRPHYRIMLLSLHTGFGSCELTCVGVATRMVSRACDHRRESVCVCVQASVEAGAYTIGSEDSLAVWLSHCLEVVVTARPCQSKQPAR